MTSVAPVAPARAPARATARREESDPSVPTTIVLYALSLTRRTLCDRGAGFTPRSRSREHPRSDPPEDCCMPATSTVAPTATLRRARAAVGACFFVNADLYANLVPRFPELKADLGLSNSSLGAAIAALPLGELVAGLSSAPLIRRFGSARVASAGLTLLAAAVWGAASAPNWAALAGALFLAGALD